MRRKRAKQYKKAWNIYKSIYGFREPFMVLVDYEFCKVCLESDIDMWKMLGRTLLVDEYGKKFKIFITACTAQKLKNTKILKNASQNTKEQSLWTQLMKSYQKHLNILDNRVANQNTSNKDHSAVSIRICKHSNPMENTLDCIEQVVKSSMPSAKFVVATQSIELRSKLRFFGPENGSIPVPLIYVNRSVMIMEPPSTAVYQTAESIERDKQAIDLPKTENNPNELVKKPKKFRKKQPNPLSCKKPKKRDPPPQKTSSRKRYRKKSSNETTSIE